MKITVDTTNFNLNVVSKQINYAASKSINATMFDTRTEYQGYMRTKIDRPTPFTISGVRVRKTTKANLSGQIYIEKKRSEYMRIIIEGGVERPKQRALRGVTGNTRLNKYGNMTRNYITKMLSNKKKYFSGVPRGSRKRPAGVWQRMGKGGRKSLRIMVTWDDEQIVKKQLEFYKPVAKEFEKRFHINFNKALIEAISSAK